MFRFNYDHTDWDFMYQLNLYLTFEHIYMTCSSVKAWAELLERHWGPESQNKAGKRSESKNEHFAVVHTHQSSLLWAAASDPHQLRQRVTKILRIMRHVAVNLDSRCRLIPSQSSAKEWPPGKGEMMICSFANRAVELTVVYFHWITRTAQDVFLLREKRMLCVTWSTQEQIPKHWGHS